MVRFAFALVNAVQLASSHTISEYVPKKTHRNATAISSSGEYCETAESRYFISGAMAESKPKTTLFREKPILVLR